MSLALMECPNIEEVPFNIEALIESFIAAIDAKLNSKETLRKINVDDSRLTAHSLRHTAVSLSIKNGASLMQAQAMARHSDQKITMIYFHNNERIKSSTKRFVIFLKGLMK